MVVVEEEGGARRERRVRQRVQIMVFGRVWVWLWGWCCVGLYDCPMAFRSWYGWRFGKFKIQD